jgi:phage anti-repressor protein
MSPNMFHDATSSTPIPVFTTNEETKNESKNLLQKENDYKSIQNELIKVDFDNKTVSARALYEFLGRKERFSNLLFFFYFLLVFKSRFYDFIEFYFQFTKRCFAIKIVNFKFIDIKSEIQ